MEPLVVGLDDSAEARLALKWALDHALATSSPLLAVTAVEHLDIVGRAEVMDELEWHRERVQRAQAWLEREVAAVCTATGVNVGTDVVEGRAVDTLVGLSRTAQAVVVGARGNGAFRRMLLGSVSSGVARHAFGPVVVVRPGSNLPARPNVVVGYDGSDGARAAVAWAGAYVRSHDGVLTIIEAWDWPTFQNVPITYGDWDPQRLAKERVERAAAETGLPDPQVRTVVTKGSAARVVVEAAADADLLVVGSRGLGGFAELLLGSVGTHSVHHAPCSVAVVRQRL